MQHLGTLSNPIKEAKVFFEEICNLDAKDFPDDEILTAYQTWLTSLDYTIEEAPHHFKIGKRTFHSSYIKVGEQYLPNPLSVKLRFLIELANLEFDVSKFHLLDNITALIYREDWSKPFTTQEYFDNAKFFEGQVCKYSFWGVAKYNELIVTLKDTYPILYQDNSDDKTDGRKMFDMLNAISGDSPTNQEAAEDLAISRAFEWMEHKKIESIKRKLKK